VISEHWENEYDFHFLSNHVVLDNSNEVTCNAQLAAVKAQIEFDFHFSDENEPLSISEGVTSHSQLASAAIKAQKAKFRIPSSDPANNQVIDTRTSEQKMADILRIWSQLLTKDETKIWNEISNCDLTHDISLKSGLRTTKSIIDREIKQFRQIAAGEKSEMLQTLQKLPVGLLLPDSEQLQSSDLSDIP
jgi:hypothetical protein